MKILVVKMSAIGDVIHTLPAVNALRRGFPEAHITWLVEESASAIVASHPSVDRVLVSKRTRWLKGLFGPSWLRNVREILHFLAVLRDTQYDIVIDFQGLMKSAVVVGLSRGVRKVGYDKTREYSYLVLNERVPPYDMDKHAVLRYLNLVKRLNVETDLVTFNIPFGEAEKQDVLSVLRRRGWVGQPIVAVNPMAKWKTKLWPAANFSELADRLVEALGCFVVFTGNGADRKEISRILSHMRRGGLDLSGQTGLKQLAALYRMSSCAITTDTGPMHLAAAVGTRVVALFGPTAPWRTGPLGEGHEVRRAGLLCSPCFSKQCDTVTCMDQISPEEIFDAVANMLKKLPSGNKFEDEANRL
jgi:heptosyltransferase-1